MTITQTCEQTTEPQVRQMMEVRQLIHQEREMFQEMDSLHTRLLDLRKNIQSRLKRMCCRKVPWNVRFVRESFFVLMFVVFAGCVSKPVPVTQRQTPQSVNALVPPTPVTSTVQGRSVNPPVIRTNITLAWSNPNPPADAKYMLTEFHSTRNLAQPFAFKCYVAAGVTNVVFPKTNAAEFYICRFAQTNVSPWLLSDWNTK